MVYVGPVVTEKRGRFGTAPALTLMRRLALLCLCLLLVPAVTEAADPKERAFARDLLQGLQERSFKENREFCGYIGRTTDGRLVATGPRRGRSTSCVIDAPPPGIRVTASYHTHAGFDPYTYGEVPSTDDVLGDMEEGINGYISTPGGRFWFVDGPAGEAWLICGAGCLLSDPDFDSRQVDPVAPRYTLKELERREGG